MTGSRSRISYAELRDRVARLAGALAARGVGKGDRVVVYMPMVPEALVAMLACARLGAIHSVVFGGFAAPELAVRIDDATAEGDHRRLVRDRAGAGRRLQAAGRRGDRDGRAQARVLRRAPARAGGRPSSAPRDLEWHAAQAGVEPAPCAPVGGMDPLYILYTSGTTGAAEGGGAADRGLPGGARLDDARTSTRIDAGDVFWTASDVGWVVGHSYICYGPLIVGATTIVFEGKPVGTPDAGAFWRVIAEHRVKSFFTAPTAFRAIKREDPEGRLIGDYDIWLARATCSSPASGPTPTR